jgi:Family of unknown function (DUF6843)
MKSLLTVGVIGFALLLQGRADPETHLIPKGYVGSVTIVFRATSGQRILDEGGARLYQIPSNGILLTEGEPNTGLSPAWRFFTVNVNSERVPIKQIWASTVADTPENRASTAVEIFYPHRGRMRPSGVPCDVEFDQYFIGTRAQLFAHDEAKERRRLSEFLRGNFVCR